MHYAGQKGKVKSQTETNVSILSLKCELSNVGKKMFALQQFIIRVPESRGLNAHYRWTPDERRCTFHMIKPVSLSIATHQLDRTEK